MGRRRTPAGEGTAQVRLDDDVELLVAGLPQDPVTQDAGVGDHRVETAESVDRGVDEEIGRLGRADRGDHDRGASPGRVDESGGLLGPVRSRGGHR
jgi:hypothetical protein